MSHYASASVAVSVNENDTEWPQQYDPKIIEDLYVYSASITELPPDLVKLERLVLVRAVGIRDVPKHLVSLKRLEIRGMSLDTFTFDGLSALSWLELADVRVKEHVTIQSDTVTRLTIHHMTRVRTLEIHMPKLRELSVSDCIDARTLKLVDVPKIRKIDIYSCSILCMVEANPKDMRGLSNLVLSETNITPFDFGTLYVNSLKFLRIDSTYVNALPNGMRSLLSLEVNNAPRLHTLPDDTLALHELKLNKTGVTSLPPHMPNLKKLVLRLSPIRAFDMPNLAIVECSNMPDLERLPMRAPNIVKFELRSCPKVRALPFDMPDTASYAFSDIAHRIAIPLRMGVVNVLSMCVSTYRNAHMARPRRRGRCAARHCAIDGPHTHTRRDQTRDSIFHDTKRFFID